MHTRVRQRPSTGGWAVDRRVLWLFWLPMGRWIHQDWWAPYDFETAAEALHFANVRRVRAALSSASGEQG